MMQSVVKGSRHQLSNRAPLSRSYTQTVPLSMEVVSTISMVRQSRSSLGTSVGFVPTMGALHEGHLSLVRAARARNDKVVCSIFVNPKQFAAHEDLGAYPRTLEQDLDLLRAEGVDLVFTPTPEEMYPQGFSTVVDPGPAFTLASDKREGSDSAGRHEQLGCAGEGGARPHFFKGVATVCTKLFNIVQPSHSYFGQKDAVQCDVLTSVVSDLAIPTEVVVVPTVRASDGLALSSRNAYLTPEEREAAPVIYAALCDGSNIFEATRPLSNAADASDGRRESSTGVLRASIEEAIRKKLAEEPLFVKEVEYVSVVERCAGSTREVPPDELVRHDRGAVVSVAVKTARGVRLIDNVVLAPTSSSSSLSSSSPPFSSSSSWPLLHALSKPAEKRKEPLVPLTPEASPPPRRLTAMDITAKWRRGDKLTMVTAYSAPMGTHVDAAGADMVLVGDSVGMVELGHRTTVGVTLDDMVHHAKAVRSGVNRALVVVDLPFGSYELSPEHALASAHRLVKECGADAVKVEGGAAMAPTVAKLASSGVAVVGHVGLTPQAFATSGGFRAQGRTAQRALGVVQDALALEAAGAFAVVVECVPAVVADALTRALKRAPTVGIGAGPGTAGQVLVFHDLVGMSSHSEHHEVVAPRFCKRYATVGTEIQRGLRSFVDEVGSGHFPSEEYSPYSMNRGEEAKFLAHVGTLLSAPCGGSKEAVDRVLEVGQPEKLY